MPNLYHRGDNILLYVKFKDEKNNPIMVENPSVQIRHQRNGEIIDDLYDNYPDGFPLTPLGMSNEYFANYIIEHTADYATYEVTYTGLYENKLARVVEEFRVVPNSDMFENVIKVYGFVNQLSTGYPMIGVSVQVELSDESEVISQSYTKEDGGWESYVYPGEYKVTFNKFGFLPQEFVFQIGLENNEIQFDNVALELESRLIKGNGVYTITDKYTTREGMAIIGLSVKAYSVFDLGTPAGEDTTNEEGKWEIFLDSGIYLLKVNGIVFDDEFDQTFRLKVSEEGDFSFEDLSSNVAVPSDDFEVSNGNGSVLVSDTVIDSNGNPIIDVQVNAFAKGKLNDIIAQDYTDPTGKWTLFLNPGSYTIEYYHPEFDVIMEDRVIS